MRRQLFGNETGLIAYYRFDEGSGSSAFDSTGNANHTVTLVNGPVWVWVGLDIVPFAPTVATRDPSVAVGPSATWNGQAWAPGSGAAVVGYFEWGPSGSLGNQTPPFPGNAGGAGLNWSATVSGLIPNTLYYFRAVARNDYGTSYGETLTYKLPTTNIVSNNSDAGPGSLRQVIQDSGKGDTIVFAPSVADDILTSGAMSIYKDLTIDASDRTNGLTICGDNIETIFMIYSGAIVTLKSLTLTGGGGGIGGDGGAILNEKGVLNVINSTLSGNHATRGGGIYQSGGVLNILNSTLSGNSASSGGGIYQHGGQLNIISSTLSRNSSQDGGGIGVSLTSFLLENSIVAGNFLSGDISGTVTFSRGVNLIGGEPQLAPLGDYGGLTQTMPPLPGSPALDRAIITSNTPASDQRGGQRVVDLPTVANGTGDGLDIGAVEAGGYLRITQLHTGGSQTEISFTTERLWSHHLESKDTLVPGPWTLVPFSERTGNGTVVTVPDTRASVPKRFYRAVMAP